MARKKKIGVGDKIFHCQIIGELKKKKSLVLAMKYFFAKYDLIKFKKKKNTFGNETISSSIVHLARKTFNNEMVSSPKVFFFFKYSNLLAMKFFVTRTFSDAVYATKPISLPKKIFCH